MKPYRRLLEIETAIDTINAKIYSREKMVKEYTDFNKELYYRPRIMCTPDDRPFITTIFKATKELILLKKIKKNLAKANIRHIQEMVEENDYLTLSEYRTLMRAMDNLKEE